MRKATHFVLPTAHRSPLIAGPGDFAGTLHAGPEPLGFGLSPY
jgi:hypothetical protein